MYYTPLHFLNFVLIKEGYYYQFTFFYSANSVKLTLIWLFNTHLHKTFFLQFLISRVHQVESHNERSIIYQSALMINDYKNDFRLN